MKKTLSLVLALALALCLCVPALAAGSYTVTIINGMDGSVAETFTVADGEDLVFTISCSAPCDMGPVADGEEGSGVTTTDGVITYSNITTGGPNAYPTAETVTISGIKSDAEVTVTPNPDEVEAEFPAITEGAGSASGEASDEASGEMSVEEAYVEYINEFLLAELEINSTMTEEQIPEFMALVEAGDYESFPADMLYNGMLESGSAMTFEEFAAQYVPAGSASGDTSEDAYHAYLKEYVDAVPAVSDEQYLEFAALIDASDYTTMPADMLFNAQWWGYAAMTYDEFVAAGGVYEIPAFDPNLTAD